MSPQVADAGSTRVHHGNPFPGLRPFEPHESSLFFGREDQIDDVLSRLGRRRLVAVVGMSGSGKSSLVRAGRLPALDRGYLPSAGSSWQIAIFRPGSDPVANLTRGLVERRLPGGGTGEERAEDIRALLDASSLGLAAAARQLLRDTGDSLLVVADQFEELFRFERIAQREGAAERAAACVDLLLNASKQEGIPVYVVLTMRSDYLGDCAHFTGLPEALNDSQFLVPRMTRAQLREAIESPVAVGGAQITPRLVQRLLHEIEDIPSGAEEVAASRRDQDELPVLQHALMRMWEVSRTARERGEPIDLLHYEQPPVETLRHALDRHAEEVYQGLPTDLHREVARVVFQQLTDRDVENREVRRATPFGELAAVARRAGSSSAGQVDESMVSDVIGAFSAPGRAFVVVNAQQDVDISHESFIRRWTRLHEWVRRESRSRRVYMKLADVAASWQQGEASLYRGPELAESRRWWNQETPTQEWANRYDPRFDVAQRFLEKSVRGRRLRLGLVFGNIAVLLVAATTIAVLMKIGRDQAQASEAQARAAEAQARAAEAEALQVRTTAATQVGQLEEANRLIEQALALERQGRTSQAEVLVKQAQQVEAAKAGSVLTQSELSELERLRRQETAWRQTEAELRSQIAAQRTAAPGPDLASPAKTDLASADRTELDRLKSAEASWEREQAQLRQQVAAANDRATKAQAAENALRAKIDALQTADDFRRPDTTRPTDTVGVEQILREYEAAYERRDANAVVRLMPSASAAELSKSFSQVRAYQMEILDAKISVTGDTAVVNCVRRVSIEPRVGSRPPPRTIPTVMRLRQSQGAWIIDSVEERR
jgi:hypothetical protein